VKTTAFSTTLKVPSGHFQFNFALARPIFALQTRAGIDGDLRIHVTIDERLAKVFEAVALEMEYSGPDHKTILLVSRDQAMLDILMADDHIVFDILSPLVTNFGFSRIPYHIRPDIDDVASILQAAAHYHWHLRRHPLKSALCGHVTIEFMKLNKVDGEFGDNDDFPKYGNSDLVADQNLNHCGLVDLVVDKDAMYGIRIVNNMNIALYPYLFYFDNSDFSIGADYILEK
jgi:hypothetical protein